MEGRGSGQKTGRLYVIGAIFACAGLQLLWCGLGGAWQIPSFPLDDAWIHQVFARSLAHGEGFRYAGHVVTSGCSSPLWAMVLAIPAALGWPPVYSTMALNLGLTLGACFFAGIWAARLDAHDKCRPDLRTAAVATLLVGANPIWAWNGANGMEGAAATFALTLGGYLRCRRTGYTRQAGNLALGFAIGFRPELSLLVPLLLLEQLYRPGEGESWIGKGAKAAMEALLCLSPIITILAILHASTGDWFPQTLEAKTGPRLAWRLVAGQNWTVWLPALWWRFVDGLLDTTQILASPVPVVKEAVEPLATQADRMVMAIHDCSARP